MSLQILLLPTIFNKIAEKTFYLYGAVNFISIPIVWALYPESNQRTLEEMDLLFADDSWWNWNAEKTFARLKEENPELVQTAQRGTSFINPETGLRHGGRGASIVSTTGNKNLTDNTEKSAVQFAE